MSGYTTSISTDDAYKSDPKTSTSAYSTHNVTKKIKEKYSKDIKENDFIKIRDILLKLSAEDFFRFYSERKSYEEIPLLTADGIVIPEIGLQAALSKKEYTNIVPTIAGSNRDEVKLWLATAEYFVNLDSSFISSILRIPRVQLTDEPSFEAFNYYRSSAWKIRGVDDPLKSLATAGNKNLYAYRYDWDDHRRLFVANFKKLIGAAHATEIPLLAGNSDLVGGYPLSDLIYPPSVSKRFLSKNMMLFWSNFAKTGSPGISTNSIEWEKYDANDKSSNYLILDRKKNLKMEQDRLSFETLANELAKDNRVNDLEKCVILLQMFTFGGDELYEKYIKNYPKKCVRDNSEQFLIDNASFIEY